MHIRRWIAWGLLTVAVLGISGTIFGFWRAGYRAYIVQTGSMSPTLAPGDLVIDRPASTGYRPGDIITFRHSPAADVVTHRMVDLANGAIHTKGDANRTADVWNIPPSYVEGVVDLRLPGLGYAVVFLRQPTGFASVVLSLIALILLWRLFFPSEEAGIDTTPGSGSSGSSTADSVAEGDPSERPAPPDAPAVADAARPSQPAPGDPDLVTELLGEHVLEATATPPHG